MMAVSKTTMSGILLLMLVIDQFRDVEPTVSGHQCSRFDVEFKLMEQFLNLELESASVNSKLYTLEEKLSSKLDTPAVSVEVGLLQETSVRNGQVIKYDRVMTNVGDGYDVSEGVFVVPVSGTYVFTVTVCLKGDAWMRTKLFHNGAQIGFFMTGDDKWETCNNDVVTTQVKQGDRVWVQRDSGSADVLYEKYGWNSFTANLLQRYSKFHDRH